MANTQLSDALVKDIQRATDVALGRKEDRIWAYSGLRSSFDQHIGALVCRNCGHLNVLEATACRNCGSSHEITIFVGHKPQPQIENEVVAVAIEETTPVSILEKQ